MWKKIRRKKRVVQKRQKILWAGVSAAATGLAGAAGMKTAGTVWRHVRKAEPPKGPELETIGLRDAVLWTILTSILGGVAGVTLKRAAAAGWKHIQGTPPPR
ncbi:MAG: DUF4235 domain-containing protein [Chitinivibrionales bacterium]|nr:DUF4235 domain-containing protein [Chitinivibrionales bacterium]